jgi:hypothetical protein
MRRIVGAAILLLIAGTVLVAQKNEIAGTIGSSFISDKTVPNTSFFDNTVHSGRGLSFNISYSRVFHRFKWGSLSAEIPVLVNPDEDLNYGANQIPEGYSSFFLTPAVRVRVLDGYAFHPWISVGGGLGHFAASKELVFGGLNPGNRIKTTGVLAGGVGFDVPLGGKFHTTLFRFEARDNWSGVAPLNVNTGNTRQHNLYVGGGLVFPF